MDTADQLFFREDSWNKCNPLEKSIILNHALAMLIGFLGIDFQFLEDFNEPALKHIAFDIKGSIGSAKFDLLDISGTLSVVDDRSSSNPSLLASLFLYSQNVKLINTKNQSFMDFLYTNEFGTGQWKFVGWFDDVFGEYPE